uniref:Uncharacterized protein n=1 Tax=Bubo bubo TaxID=30461 RepID=A0A8C0FD64_BUBBB
MNFYYNILRKMRRHLRTTEYDIKKAYQKVALKCHQSIQNLTWCKNRNDYDKPTEAGLSGKLKRSGRGKAYSTHRDIKHLNSEYVITNFYPNMFRESVSYSVKALVVTNISRIHGNPVEEEGKGIDDFFPILGVSPVPGTGLTSFGSCQAGGCSSSIASLNSSRKGNFRSVIAMSKILTGVKIPTERIVTNGKERIETGFNH